MIATIATLVALTPAAVSAQQAGPECNGLAVTILGTDGDDDIIGTSGDDVISLLDGDDTVDSGAGNDTICDTTGVFIISTGDGDDTVITGASGGGRFSEVNTGHGDDNVTTHNEARPVTAVYLGPGNDIATVVGNGPTRVYGDEDDDTIRASVTDWTQHELYGGPGNDEIEGYNAHGEDGDDIIRTAGGDSALGTGGPGNDQLIGGPLRDRLEGGPGDDLLLGKGEGDTLLGDAGNDRLIGGKGSDHLSGHQGDDVLKGGAQLDTLIGGLGADKLYGGSGNDVIEDGDGAEVRGAKGADRITINGQIETSIVKAGPGTDRIKARGKNLELHGDGGPDMLDVIISESTVYGDAGHDEIIYIIKGEGVVFWLGSGDDLVVEKPGARHLAGIEVNGGPGHDLVFGTRFSDTLRGNAGHDWMDARRGNDLVDGGKDGDTLAGGLGADTVIGGGGTDDDYCLLGHFDMVDTSQNGRLITWEGPPDAGDSGDCERTWGETGYWVYRRQVLFDAQAMHNAYVARQISSAVYGLEADLQAEVTDGDAHASEGQPPIERFAP